MKTFIISIILPLCFLLSGLKGLAQAPGGVSSNLQLWLKAGVGAGSVGTNSSEWQDQSGKGNNAMQATTSAQPSVTANQINFNPALVFNGSTDYMDMTTNLGLTGTADCAVYCVLQQSGGGLQVFFGTKAGTSNDLQLYTTPGSPTTVDYWGTGAVLHGTTLLPAGTTYISGHEKAGTGTGQATVYIDGNLDNTGTIALSMGTGNRRIGASAAGGSVVYYTTGDIAEIVAYTSALTSAQRSQLLSYLLFKYGFPPPTGAGFVTSAGAAFWTYNATYPYDIFGIGRDDGSGLSLSSSNSINTGSGNGTGQSGKGNIVLSNPSALNNLEFIVLGDNGGSLAQQTTNLPAGTPAGVERVGRQWLINDNNAVGATVTLTFNTTGLTTGSSVTDFALLIDNDGDGNFATGTQTKIQASAYSGNIATFNNVSLPNLAVMTIITSDAVTLPLNFLSFTAQPGANRQVNLAWQTSDQVNVSHFNVDRSTDGNTFTPIGQVNAGSANSYTFTDDNAVAGNNYYRIESVDNDGYTQYSTIDLVVVPPSPLQVKLLNNQPGQNDPILLFSAGNAATLNIRLLTVDGTVVSRMQTSFTAGQKQQTVSTAGLARGVYIIEVSGAGYNKNFMIVR
jgi:hypothetical protein